MISKKKYDQDLAQQRQQLNKQTQMYLAIQDENSQLQAQLDSMKDMLRMEMAKSAAQNDEDSGASNEMVNALKKEMEQMKTRHHDDLDSMLKRIKDKEGLLQQAKDELEKFRQNDQTAELQAKISDLEEELQQVKEEAAKSGAADSVSSEAHTKATKQFQSLIDKQQKAIDELEEKLARESSTRMKLEDEVEELTDEASHARDGLKTTQNLLVDCEERVSKLTDEKTDLEEKLQAAVTEVATLNETISKQSAQLEAAQTELEEAVAASTKAQSQAETDRQKCEEFRQAKEVAERQLSANENRIKTQEQMIQELDKSHAKEMKHMKINYRRSAHLVKNLKKELSRLAKKFSRQEAELYRLQKAAHELEDARDRIEVWSIAFPHRVVTKFDEI